MSLKTYSGACRCGQVRYEADIDPDAGGSLCHCAICKQMRKWAVIVQPHAFRLLSGQDALGDGPAAAKAGHYLCCRHCGTQAFERGGLKALGGEYYAVRQDAFESQRRGVTCA